MFCFGVSCLSSDISPRKVNDAFVVLQIAIDDHPLENIGSVFRIAFEFIDHNRRSNKHVLVHCEEGISRSPTIGILRMHQRLISFGCLTQLFRFSDRILDGVKEDYAESSVLGGAATKANYQPCKFSFILLRSCSSYKVADTSAILFV